MMWRKTKKMTFVVKENGREIPVKNAMLFEVTDAGEIIVYDGAEQPYTALMSIRNVAEKLMEMMTESMERKLEEAANGICADDAG